ncbi:MAG: helix-turn-helix transcriptional regulator [Solirubrobacteraceae bacterium]
MRHDISPTARALRALELLASRPGVTAAELAARLGVSQRAARRYVAILREADIPVESARGPGGGYRLGRGTRLPPVSFTEHEALELVMAVLESHPALGQALGPRTDSDGPHPPGVSAPAHPVTDGVGSALSKVIRALPARIGRQAAALRDHSATAPDRHAKRPDPAITSALVTAIASSRRVRLGYRSAFGNEWESEIDPWAVVARHNRWYLLCHSLHANATRTYRLDRVSSVTTTTTVFTRPAVLDPVQSLEENLGEGWAHPTRVVFEAPASDVTPYVRPPMGRLHAHPDGCVLIGTTSNPTMYACEWLAAIPVPFRVEGGDELRAAVTALAHKSAHAIAPRAVSAPSPNAEPGKPS